jgi:DNA-binding FrmR family transcriptional regulator
VEPRTQAEVLRRLHCVEGHLRGIAEMTEHGWPCPAIVHQIQAIQGSLRQISTLLLSNHLDTCLRDACAGMPDTMYEQLRREMLALLEQRV